MSHDSKGADLQTHLILCPQRDISSSTILTKADTAISANWHETPSNKA